MDNKIRDILVKQVLPPLLAILTGLIVGGMFIILINDNPLLVFKELYIGAFGSKVNFLTTLQWATPIIFMGLSGVIAFKSGIFNIGIQGQFILGGIVAGFLGFELFLPSVIHKGLILLFATIAGALWAFIPVILKTKWSINEIVTTTVMNFLAVLLLSFLVNGPMRDPTDLKRSYSHIIQTSAILAPLVQTTRWSISFFIALLMVLIMHFFLQRTSLGYESRIVGVAPIFAKYGGIRTMKVVIRSMLISGGISGFAGALEVMGVYYRLTPSFCSQIGFDGVMVALLGQGSPIGVLFTSFIFAGLRQGALSLGWTTNTPRQLGGTIIALIILFMSARKIVTDWYEKRKSRKMIGDQGSEENF